LRGGAALAEGFIEDDGTGGRDVEGADAAGHGDTQEVVAGAADKIMETGPLAAEDEDAVAGEVETVVVGLAALVEANDPQILALEVFKSADEVDDAGDAEMLSGAGAGLDGDRAEGRGATFGEHDSIDSSTVGHAQQGTEVLRVLNSIESQEQTRRARRSWEGWERVVEVFNGERFLGTDQGNDTLVGGGRGELGKLLAGLRADANARLTTGFHEAGEAVIVALARHYHLVKAPATGLEGLLDRMQAVENFHEG
jgi:hypothetical protein